MPPVISVDHLVKRYGDLVAVRDVSFQVQAGEIFGILGPNGSGKTTTVESLQGLRGIDGGTVSVLGLDPATRAHEIRRRVGSQLQESALPDRIKVWEALDLFGALDDRGPTTDEALEAWGLADKRTARFGDLSGGQRQRLFVALALVNAPEIVFLDEMTTGLDPASRRVTWELIRQIRARGTTVVLVTHFMDEAEALCDRLVVIDHGEVVAAGTTAELIDRYGGGTRIEFTADSDDVSWLDAVPGVDKWEREGHRCRVSGNGPVLVHLAAALLDHGLAPADLRQDRPSLEDVFLAITSEGTTP